MNEFIALYVGIPSAIGGVMEFVKQFNIVDKKWYLPLGIVASAIYATIITFATGFSIWTLLGGFIVTFAVEYGVDKKFWKPLLELILSKK